VSGATSKLIVKIIYKPLSYTLFVRSMLSTGGG